MPKSKVSDYSSTASNNTDVGGINIAEGMAPSNVNNAMREMMAQLKDWQSGAVSQDMTVNGGFTASGNVVLSSDVTVGDDLIVTGDASIGGVMTCTGNAVMSSNLTVGGILNVVGGSSFGAITFSGATVMSSTLTVEGASTLKGNATVGTSTSNTLTLNSLLSTGGGTGTSGQVLKTNGTASTPAWTSLSSMTEFDKSLATSGYQKLPGGLIIQWGEGTSNTDNAQTFNFALTFPSACLQVIPHIDASAQGAVTSFNTSGFTFDRGTDVNGTTKLRWVAFGY